VDVSSASGRDPVDDFETVSDELRRFAPEVAAKPQIVAASKIDALDDPSRLDRLEKHVVARGLTLHRLSAVTGEGVDQLLEAAWRRIAAVRAVTTGATLASRDA
jgi:GTP-binding protein